jgi:transcriptional antiterminator NusG
MSIQTNAVDDDQDVVDVEDTDQVVESVDVDTDLTEAELESTDEEIDVITVPETPGKKLSLKEKLAARRLAEQGVESEDSEGQWYVLHTYSGYENKVKKTIETRVDSLDLGDRVYEIVVPTQEEIEIKNGQRQTVLKKVFPGYVLVRMELDDETWYALRNTPGVTGFVNVDNKPVPLDETRVQAIMKGMVAEAPKVKVTFALGDTVRINDGPFADFRGEIDEINQEKGKIRVLVSFFGRETPVELDFLQAERET